MKRDLQESINHAVDGIVYAFRTERNLKIHIAVSLVVLVSCLLVDLKSYELLGVFLLIAMVIVAEMFNTAIETLVNLQTVSHHPLAKIAKDVAAGGVFIACITSVIGGYLIFWEPFKKMLWGESARVLYHSIALHYTHGLIVLLTIILVGVMIGKALGRKGTFTRGGLGVWPRRSGVWGEHGHPGHHPQSHRHHPGICPGPAGGTVPGGGEHPPLGGGPHGGSAGDPGQSHRLPHVLQHQGTLTGRSGQVGTCEQAREARREGRNRVGRPTHRVVDGWGERACWWCARCWGWRTATWCW